MFFFGSRWLCGEMHGGMVEKVGGGSKMQDAMHVVKKKLYNGFTVKL